MYTRRVRLAQTSSAPREVRLVATLATFPQGMQPTMEELLSRRNKGLTRRSDSILTPACADICRQYKSPLTGDPVLLVTGGGVNDGRSLASALMLGASGVWVGTRFIPTVESKYPEVAKQQYVVASPLIVSPARANMLLGLSTPTTTRGSRAQYGPADLCDHYARPT